MPEIGEVARIVNYLQKHVVGKTLAVVKAQHDEIVFGKVGCSAEAFEKALTGKKVLGAQQQGKYFWMEMSSPPHPLMHFGMTGWINIRGEETPYYKPENSKIADEWPPKFCKFALQTAEEPKAEAAFVDKRRLARIRLIDCAGSEIRKVSPLIQNGPDPVIDKEIFTEDWLGTKLATKKVPIKALLLDQANISGIGNWVGDEVLYSARIHPEQYSNTLSPEQVKQLHKSIQYVCGFAVDSLADSSRFPEDWLFKHRWGKGKRGGATNLPNGDKIVFLTVGGRTSCVVPRVQKKTGPVAKDIEDQGEENVKSESEDKERPTRKDEVAEAKDQERTVKEETEPVKNVVVNGVAHKRDKGTQARNPVSKKRKLSSDEKTEDVQTMKISGRRRSTRVSGKGL